MRANVSLRLLGVLCALTLALCAGPALADGPVTLNVPDAKISIGSLYDGTSLKVSGTVPAGSQVVLRFLGKTGELHMKKKDKALGLLWMNMGSVAFENVPSVCLIDSSSDLAGMGQAGQALGLDGLRQTIKVASGADGEAAAAMTDELLKLKRNEKLYRETSGDVTLAPAEGGVQNFTVDLRIPSRLSPGDYTVEAVAILNGAEAGRASQTVSASMVGGPAFLADMAFGHGALYGVLATIIAILGGLGIGLVFQSKGAH